MRRLREPVEVGSYRTLAELGEGGMGRVLLSSGPDGRLVAVKLVREMFVRDTGFRERFRREVAASRRVSGAYTAPVIDADADATVPWLASVFVYGPSLHQAVQHGGVLAEEPALRLAAGLATALTEIHRVGLVHRDLKPANVLLTEDGPRVIDFGIAKVTDDDSSALTHTGLLVGSPSFMSPEHADGRELTPASDVFSLGSVLVMACTGKSPFAAPAAAQSLYNVVHSEPDLTALPARVRQLAAACLAKDPAERPSPAQLVEMIGEITPSQRPWPAWVHTMVADQRAEVARLLDPSSDHHTVDLAAGALTMAATREYLGPPADPSAGTPGPPPAARPGTTKRGAWTAAALVLTVALVTAVVLAVMSNDGERDNAGDQGNAGTTSPETETTTTSVTPTTFDPNSWNTDDADPTPLTADALLPASFVNDKEIEFALVASSIQDCAAANTMPEVSELLISRGCTRILTGSYLEQPGPYATPENPVLVSVTVIPFHDSGAAAEMAGHLTADGNGTQWWSIPTWCPESGVGHKPCAGSDGALRTRHMRAFWRYVIDAMAVRTDLSTDDTITPWLQSACVEAANSSGPENYQS